MSRTRSLNLSTTGTLSATLLCLLACGCLVVPILDETTSPIADGPTSDEIRAAIIRGATQRDWLIEDVSDGSMIAQIDVRGRHHAEVDIHYTLDSYSIQHRSTTGLRESEGLIYPNYNRWVLNLKQSIDREIGQLAVKYAEQE